MIVKKWKNGIGSRLLYLLLCICIGVGCAWPGMLNVSAVSGSCGEGTTWDLTNGVLTLGGSGAVQFNAWSGYSAEITSVVVGDSITALPNKAFTSCSKLSSVSFGKSLKEIPSNLCNGCSTLKTVKFSEGLQKIGAGAFTNCYALQTVTLPSTLQTIGDKAFYACLKSTVISIPDSVKTIGAEAFKANNAKTLKLGSSLETIGKEAFALCCFSEAEIPESVKSIGAAAFGIVYSTISRSGSGLSTVYNGTQRKVTIIGEANSTAQQYAQSESLPFKLAGETEHTHAWSAWINKTLPGCESEGLQTRTCDACGETESRAIPATGHSWSDWKTEIPAGCETAGKQIRTCSACGKQESQTLEATGHSWSDWKTEIPAGCETEGKQVRTCSACGTQESHALPATGHLMGNWEIKTAPGCETDGENVRYCAHCDHQEHQKVSATGHSWGEWTVKTQPTVDKAGVQESVCLNCGTVRTNEIPKLIGYTVSVTASEGGSVNPSGEMKIAEGEGCTITVQPENGWQLLSVLVNGSEVQPDGQGNIRLSDIRANMTVSVVFQKKAQPKTRSCNFVDVTPKRNVWLTDESGLSVKDFQIHANITDNGNVSWLDITADCVPAAAGMPNAEPYGTGTVTFKYQGSDAEVKEYLEQNSITGQIPLFLRGDGNLDGSVDVADAEFALTYYVKTLTGKTNTGFSEEQCKIMDVDSNGITTLEDAVFILQYYTRAMAHITPDWNTIIRK